MLRTNLKNRDKDIGVEPHIHFLGAKLLESVLKNKRLFLVLFLLVVLLPIHSASAQIADVEGYVGSFLTSVISWLGSWVGGAARLLDLVANFKVVSDAGDIRVVAETWKIVRDLVNMFFIVALIIMAFATIFGVSQYDYRSLLAKFLIAALLINFSLLIGTTLIRLSQTLTSTFLQAIGSIADKLGENLIGGLNGIPGITNTQAVGNSGYSLVVDINAKILPMFSVIIMLVIMLVCFLIASVFVFIRIPILWFLLILSPVAWIAIILPSPRHLNSKWWKQFTAWTLFLPIYLFFVYIGIFILNNSTETIRLLKEEYLTAQISGWGLGFQVIFNYGLVIMFMVGGIVMAMSSAMFAGTGLVKMGQWTKEAAGGDLVGIPRAGAIRQR